MLQIMPDMERMAIENDDSGLSLFDQSNRMKPIKDIFKGRCNEINHPFSHSDHDHYINEL